MNINPFKHDDWVKIYDGRWSFLTSTHFIDQYTKEITFGGRPFKSQSIIFAAHGRSNGWMRQRDRDRLGIYLSKQIAKNPRLAKTIADKLRTQAKDFLTFIDQHENTVATAPLYDEFWRCLLSYYKAHINVKYVVDYLSPALLDKNLPILEKARLAAEPVLNRTEDFMISFCGTLSQRTNYNPKLLLCLTKYELADYFKTGKLPAKSELKKRNEKAVLLGERGRFVFYTGDDVKKVEKLVQEVKDLSTLIGQSAFPGKVSGKARIVVEPKKSSDFQTGDILVAGATRPDFLPLMHKAATFVTDAGGILSHAAITAREMKKPCVIGTKVATKILKNGDRVEVNANQGWVRKL